MTFNASLGIKVTLKFKPKLKSFTLTEVLVVLIIIGILVLLALPSLMPLISKAKSTEAKLQLEHVYTLERAYFFENSQYSKAAYRTGGALLGVDHL